MFRLGVEGIYISLLAAIDPTGPIGYKMWEGAVNGDFFTKFNEKMPDTTQLGQRKFLIMDNLSVQKVSRVGEAELAKGLDLLYFSAYVSQ